MRQKVILTIALLCAVVQGAWADTWDGVTFTKPKYYDEILDYNSVIAIEKAAELAYIQRNFASATGYTASNAPQYFYEANYVVLADIDMVSWSSMGNSYRDTPYDFTGTFYGNSHTIRLHISDAKNNYQGLFARIKNGGKVQDLYVAGNISCETSRLVGGIAGENYGTILNCWVSADVSSNWQESSSLYTAKVGGIAGENHGTVQYCCMSGYVTNNDADVGGLVGYNNGGTIDHCTFYGTRYSTHDQNSIYVGDQGGTLTNVHDNFTDEELATYVNSCSSYTVYCNALQYPFSVSVSSEGYGTITSNPTATRSGKAVALTLSEYTMLTNLSVKDADGNEVALNGNATDGYTFTMPKRDVNVTVTFGAPNWNDADKRAAEFSTVNGNTVTIKTEAELALLAYLSNTNENYGRGMTFLLDADLDMSAYSWTPISSGEANAFKGTIDGQGHTISGINVSVGKGSYAGIFGYISGTAQNLRLINSSITKTEWSVAGGIAGKSDGGTIQNCYVGSDVTVTAPSESGGIVGITEDGGTDSKIEGCYSAATVSGNYSVGGIVGRRISGDIFRNVSQATIQLTGENNYNYAYIIGCDENDYGNNRAESNYYIDRAGINDTDTRAYHVTLDDNLKAYGYSIAYKNSEYEYDCSGLKFMSGDQFMMGDEWYVGGDRTFYFKPANDLDGAVLEGVMAGGSPVSKENGYYSFRAAEDIAITGTMELILANNSDNSSLLDRFNGHTMKVTLGDHTLFRDGSWNTICLPFELTAEQLASEDCPLKGATVKTLTGSSFADGTLTLKFSDYPLMFDGTPYLVKWTSGSAGEDLQSPTFPDVTINKTPGNASSTYVDFVGSFSPVSLDASDRSVLFLGADNKLYYPSEVMTIGSCRAYFRLKGLTAGDLAQGVKGIVFDFGNEDPTSIKELQTKDEASDAAWYAIDGRRLSAGPATRGVYVLGGKKIAIK